ncbi:MAG: ABC transporter permease [Phycisphaerales bacterium]
MRKVLAVAWREFKHTALTKAFAFAALGVPALVAILLVVMPALTKPNLTPLDGTLVVVSSDPSVADSVRSELGGERLRQRLKMVVDDATLGDPAAPQGVAPRADPNQPADPDAAMGTIAAAAAMARTPKVDLTIESAPMATDLDALKDRVRRGELAALAVVPDAALAIPAEGGTPATFELFVPGGFTPNHTMLLRSAVGDAVARARAARAGVDYDATRRLIKAPGAEILRVDRGGGEKKEQVLAKLLIPVAFMMLLWMSVFVSANYLLTTTIEEKSSKVMEVLLSAVSPMQLMAGKILGQGLVSAVMLLAYGGVGLASLGVLASLDLVPLSALLYLGVYYVMAYFMVASMMAGVGSAANDIHEAQSLIGPAMMLMMIPLMLWFPISENPNGWLATVASFIPPLIPFVMILRVTAANEPVAAWQVALSIVWGYTAMIGMVWLASRIFRVGVLMQGKTPTPRELLRWLAYR